MYDRRGRVNLVWCGQSHLRHRCSELRSSSEWHPLFWHRHPQVPRSFRNNLMCTLDPITPCSTWLGLAMVFGCRFVCRVPYSSIMPAHITICKTWMCSLTSRRWSVGSAALSYPIFRCLLFDNTLATEKAGLYFVHISALTIACRRLWIGTGNGIIISVPLTDSKLRNEESAIICDLFFSRTH